MRDLLFDEELVVSVLKEDSNDDNRYVGPSPKEGHQMRSDADELFDVE